MDYKKLTRDQFDAVVTGELTHYAIWLEEELVGIISGYFAKPDRLKDLSRLLLRRDGLTFQDKIEIVRAMAPLIANEELAGKLRKSLNRIEEFKANRNAFAHGLDVTPKDTLPPTVHIEVVNRAGKEKIVVVTPETHAQELANAESALAEIVSIREEIGV
jgi:hypothetical protein